MTPSNLSVVQKFLLRVVTGQAGKTVQHQGRLVEVVDAHDSIRLLMPLVEADLSESNYTQTFWAPRRPSNRRQFNVERRDRSRSHLTIGVASGEPFPHGVRRMSLKSRFPAQPYLDQLEKLAYPPVAIRAAQIKAHWFWAFTDLGQSDRKANGKRFDDPLHPYIPSAPIRRTTTGGGFSEEQVKQGLAKMRTDINMKTALTEVVLKRRSPQTVASEFGMSRAKLDVYASRLRSRIRQEPELAA